MRKNINRRKFNKKIFFYILISFFIVLVSITIYYQKNQIPKIFDKTIQSISEDFEYQFVNLNINGLEKVKFITIEKKLKKYLNTSIFLLPLNKISNELKENNWIKNINLSTNYKDTLILDIEEYEAIGIYKFNTKMFYFDINGKIIDEIVNKTYDNNLIIFSGKLSNINAKSIINILNNLNFQKNFRIKKINYIEKRRWDIILANNIRLMLSENNPRNSLENFINIKEKISEMDFINIKYFDLRNNNKTLIKYSE